MPNKNERDALNDIMGAKKLRLVTPNNTTDLPDGVCDRLHISVAGALEVIAEDDTSPVVVPNVPVGEFRCRVKRVRAAGTTATGIVAMY